MNLQKFYMGESFDAYEYFGAHLRDGGVVFRTYAPNARKISVKCADSVYSYAVDYLHPYSERLTLNERKPA